MIFSIGGVAKIPHKSMYFFTNYHNRKKTKEMHTQKQHTCNT